MLLAAAPVHAVGAALLAAAAPLDTIVTKQAPIDPGWFERVSQGLSTILTFAFVVLTIAVVPAAWSFRKSYQKISGLLDKVYADVMPITHHGARVLKNLDVVTTAVRGDVARVSELVARAEQRIDETLARAEARARDLEALLDVAQSQAEVSFVAAASTVAGVREGFAALRDDLAGLRPVRVARDLVVEPADDEFAPDAGPEVPGARGPRIRSRDA